MHFWARLMLYCNYFVNYYLRIFILLSISVQFPHLFPSFVLYRFEYNGIVQGHPKLLSRHWMAKGCIESPLRMPYLLPMLEVANSLPGQLQITWSSAWYEKTSGPTECNNVNAEDSWAAMEEVKGCTSIHGPYPILSSLACLPHVLPSQWNILFSGLQTLTPQCQIHVHGCVCAYMCICVHTYRRSAEYTSGSRLLFYMCF